MGVYRSFIVWVTGIVAVLGAFLAFTVAGWPGTPNECVYSTPDTCFCEAFNRSDVEHGAPGVRQAVNTWFNLYSIVTSFIVALFVFLDRRNGGTPPANLMRSNSLVPDLYVFAVLFLGLGSMWFHGSLTAWGGVVDGMSMYVYAAFLALYSIRRIWNSPWFFWSGYLLTVALFTFLHTVLPAVVNIIILVAAYLVVEVVIWVRSGRVMQGRALTIALWLMAVAAILVATFFWVASQTGNFMCNPYSLFQPHGILWHPLAGVMAILLYFYWREARDND